jgi:hypothetical protein
MLSAKFLFSVPGLMYVYLLCDRALCQKTDEPVFDPPQRHFIKTTLCIVLVVHPDATVARAVITDRRTEWPDTAISANQRFSLRGSRLVLSFQPSQELTT